MEESNKQTQHPNVKCQKTKALKKQTADLTFLEEDLLRLVGGPSDKIVLLSVCVFMFGCMTPH